MVRVVCGVWCAAEEARRAGRGGGGAAGGGLPGAGAGRRLQGRGHRDRPRHQRQPALPVTHFILPFMFFTTFLPFAVICSKCFKFELSKRALNGAASRWRTRTSHNTYFGHVNNHKNSTKNIEVDDYSMARSRLH